MSYEIVDWIYRKHEDDLDFSNEDNLKQSILRFDEADKIKGWMGGSSDWTTDKHIPDKHDRKATTGKTLQEGLDGYFDTDAATAEIDQAETVEELRAIKDSGNARVEEYKNNLIFNQAMTTFRELRDAGDIEGLRELKNRVSGIEFEDEVQRDIDREIEKLSA